MSSSSYKEIVDERIRRKVRELKNSVMYPELSADWDFSQCLKSGIRNAKQIELLQSEFLEKETAYRGKVENYIKSPGACAGMDMITEKMELQDLFTNEDPTTGCLLAKCPDTFALFSIRYANAFITDFRTMTDWAEFYESQVKIMKEHDPAWIKTRSKYLIFRGYLRM